MVSMSVLPSFLHVSMSALLCFCSLLVTWDASQNRDHIVPPPDLLVLSEFSEGDHPPLQMYLGHLGSCSLIAIYSSYTFKFQRHLP